MACGSSVMSCGGVQVDRFRSTVVVTLSVNMMRTHLYYYSMRFLYGNVFYYTNILHVCVVHVRACGRERMCVCMRVSNCVHVSI